MDSPKSKFTRLFSDSPEINVGTVFGQSGTEISGLIWVISGLIFGLILVHEYGLCVIAKINNMTGCVKIILLMYAQLMY